MSMDNNKTFVIVEFSDGLQIVPAIWLNTIKQTCIWPSHFKTQLRINKAIMTGEIPKENCDWQELPIKRIFGSASSYEKSMEKLILAQGTSNVDDTDVPFAEREERDKKRRRIKAKRKISTSSEDEELFANKENSPIQNGKLLSFPQIDIFTSSSTSIKETSRQSIENAFLQLSENDKVCSFIQNQKECVTMIDARKEDSSASEFRKQVLLKLSKLLYKMDKFENMLNVFEEKIQFKDNEDNEECDIQFPLVSIQDLTNFEEQLQDSKFKQKMKQFDYIHNIARLQMPNLQIPSPNGSRKHL